MLNHTYNILHYLFIHDTHYCILGNNSNELLAHRKQGGILTTARGDIYNLISSSGEDSSGLGCWNYLDIINSSNKIRIISVY